MLHVFIKKISFYLFLFCILFPPITSFGQRDVRIPFYTPSVSSSRVKGSSNLRNGLKKIDIPFEYINDFIVLDVVFNKSLSLKFILDTGAEHTILTERAITDLLGVPYIRKFSIRGSDLTQDLSAYLIRNIHFQVENVNVSNHSMLVLEEDYFQFEEFTGLKIHGIIGADFFRGYVLKFDYPRKLVSLTAAHLFEPPKNKNYMEVPLSIERSKPYITTNLQLQSTETLPVKLLLDTGASISLLVNTNTDTLLQIPKEVIRGKVGHGLGGDLEGYLGRVNKLSLGELTLREVLTNFQELPLGVDSLVLNGRNGIIGNQILNRFDIIIDYPREKLYLKPNKRFKKKFKYDKSGLDIYASGNNLNTFLIQQVLSNSPAAEVDIRVNDQIVKLNGLPIGLFQLKDVLFTLKKKEGKKIRMIIKRDGKRLKKVFRLRKLI